MKRPTAEEQRHFDRVGQMGCLVCDRPATLHHVTGHADRMGRISRSHKRIVPLCRAHHQHDYGLLSVERLGHRGFFLVHGIDLFAEAEELWKGSAALERRAA